MLAARAAVILVALAPVGVQLAVLARAKRNLTVALVAIGLGAVSFLPAALVEGWVRSWSGLDEHARGPLDLAAFLYAFLVAAPLEQGLKVAATVPIVRARRIETPLERIACATSVAAGFIAVHNAEFLWDRPLSGLACARAIIAAPAHMFCAATWAYALGRDARRRFGGRTFNLTWLVATLFNGVFDHIVFARSALALIAAIPLLATMSFLAFVLTRDALGRGDGDSSRPRRFSVAPPSIGAVRAALRRTERPVMWRWIVGGALVTTGVLTTSLAGAVALGHRVGVDFAAVDRGEASAATAAPLLLLGAAALGAFPVSAFLVARAQEARSVLEPAIASGLAIAGCLVLLGLAAPVAVVFAIAFAPVAFALACVGAWMGMAR